MERDYRSQGKPHSRPAGHEEAPAQLDQEARDRPAERTEEEDEVEVGAVPRSHGTLPALDVVPSSPIPSPPLPSPSPLLLILLLPYPTILSATLPHFPFPPPPPPLPSYATPHRTAPNTH